MNKNSFLIKLLEFYGICVPHRGKWWVHGKIRKLFNLKIDEDIEVSRAGLKWILNPSDYAQQDLFWFGIKDLWDIYHLKKLLKPGSVIFDIGANIGYYSIILANWLKNNCTIYAFEPCSPTLKRLRENIRLNDLNKCISVIPMGVSDVEGISSLTACPGNTGATYFSQQTAGDIPLTTIDSFCTKHNIGKIDFIKIDVEGFEPFVLKGALEIIRNTKPIILIELNPGTLRRLNFSVQKVVDILSDYGYSLFISKRRKLEPLIQLPKDGSLLNAFCLYNKN